MTGKIKKDLHQFDKLETKGDDGVYLESKPVWIRVEETPTKPENSMLTLTIMASIVFLLYKVFLVVMGFIGAQNYAGTATALMVIAASTFLAMATKNTIFKFMFNLPVLVGAVYGLMHVFNFHPALAILTASVTTIVPVIALTLVRRKLSKAEGTINPQ